MSAASLAGTADCDVSDAPGADNGALSGGA